MINNNDVIIIISTNIEDDDLLSIINSLEFKDKTFLVTDTVINADASGIIYTLDKFDNLDYTISNIKSILADSGKTAVGIIGLDEEYHYRISLSIADALSLQYYDQRVLDIASNKYLQKKVFSEAKVRIPKYLLFDIDTGIPNSTIEQIGFPNVLKPITGYGSYEIYVNDDIKMLKQNISSIKNSANDSDNPDSIVFNNHTFLDNEGNESSIDPAKFFIIEEYVGGDEYSCDFIIDKGRVDVLRVVKKIPGAALGQFNGFILFNPDTAKFSPFKNFRLASECHKIASALGISEGVCMVDFKYYNDEIIVIESTVRPGIATFIELMSLIYGYTSINMIIRQKLEVYTKIQIPETIGASIFLVTKSLGAIDKLDIANISDINGIELLKEYLYYNSGHIITDPDYDNGITLLGYVQIKILSEPVIESLFYDMNNAINPDK
jgi:hypothetical protein